MKYHYFLIYKPFGMMSQFSREGDKATLADLSFDFAKDVYPVGRLDADSEGLLFLTNDTFLNNRLLNPKFKHQRTYFVQVDGQITDTALKELQKGVKISIDGKPHQTLPAKVELLVNEPPLPPRTPPIRVRQNIPTSWIALTLHEGKNRQVRRMTAAVGFPTLRLVRWAIEDIKLGTMQPAEVVEVEKEWLFKKLKINR
ncbi:pseudouridine synthase [Runella salmonicolor]|uniref:Pseudouridine synthase n=1 Tax=Runella salmonicolor TaxID=2950278 RepID=A0ABT1FWI8_9BACT|nr:pseudouridine synthase [Runella salmonicolor]MCP1386123.1 pseudouridine synthase [Runella salmonicolor]